MRKALIFCSILLFFSVIECDAGDWKKYYQGTGEYSHAQCLYRNVTILSSDIREVDDLLQSGNGCAITRYQINCKTKELRGTKFGMGPCGTSIELKESRMDDWMPLDKNETFAYYYPAMNKLIDIVCSKRK